MRLCRLYLLLTALSRRILTGVAIVIAGVGVTIACKSDANNNSKGKNEEVARGKKAINEVTAQAEENGGLSALNPHPSATSTPSSSGINMESGRRKNGEPFPHAYSHLPVYEHPIVFPPHMPPPITSDGPVCVRVNMNTFVRTKAIDDDSAFDWWSFNGGSPGPVIRLRQKDVLEIHFTNLDQTGMQHNIDFHAIQGPGGGSSLLTADQGETKIAVFKPPHPGFFLYHCAMAPAPVHLAQGMYGVVLVEPEGGIQPRADKEYCLVQAELYVREREGDDSTTMIAQHEEHCRDEIEKGLSGLVRLEMDVDAGLKEQATYVLFNGRKGTEAAEPPLPTTKKGGGRSTEVDGAQSSTVSHVSMIHSAGPDDTLRATPGENIRLFFANAGPNLVSSFHCIGGCWDRVWREADLISPPAQAVQTTLVPAGGAVVVDFKPSVPGVYTLVDHSLFRIEKGAVRFIHVRGDPVSRPDLYGSASGQKGLKNCDNCHLHP